MAQVGVETGNGRTPHPYEGATTGTAYVREKGRLKPLPISPDIISPQALVIKVSGPPVSPELEDIPPAMNLEVVKKVIAEEGTLLDEETRIGAKQPTNGPEDDLLSKKLGSPASQKVIEKGAASRRRKEALKRKSSLVEGDEIAQSYQSGAFRVGEAIIGSRGMKRLAEAPEGTNIRAVNRASGELTLVRGRSGWASRIPEQPRKYFMPEGRRIGEGSGDVSFHMLMSRQQADLYEKGEPISRGQVVWSSGPDVSREIGENAHIVFEADPEPSALIDAIYGLPPAEIPLIDGDSLDAATDVPNRTPSHLWAAGSRWAATREDHVA